MSSAHCASFFANFCLNKSNIYVSYMIFFSRKYVFPKLRYFYLNTQQFSQLLLAMVAVHNFRYHHRFLNSGVALQGSALKNDDVGCKRDIRNIGLAVLVN